MTAEKGEPRRNERRRPKGRRGGSGERRGGRRGRGRRGGPGPRPRDSTLEVLGTRYHLSYALLSLGFVGDDGEPYAELDLYAEALGAQPCCVALDRIILTGVRRMRDVEGQMIIDPPPDLMQLQRVDRLREGGPPSSTADRPGRSPGPGLHEEPEAAGDAEEPAPPCALEEPPLPDDVDPDEVSLDDDPMASEFERSIILPSLELDVQRLRLQLGQPQRGRIRCRLHCECEPVDESGRPEGRTVPVEADLWCDLEVL